MNDGLWSNTDWRVKVLAIVFLLSLSFTWAVHNWMDAITALPPWQQFLMVMLPIYIVGAVMIGIGIKDGLRTATGVLSVIAATHLIAPPYVVSQMGVLSNAALATATIESMLLVFYAGFLPLELVWYAVYPFTFTVFIGIGLFLLSKSEFRRAVHG